jgi:hypothetical protein
MVTKTEIFDGIVPVLLEAREYYGQLDTTLVNLAVLSTVKEFDAYDSLIQQMPDVLTELVIPIEADIRKGNDYNQKTEIINTISTLLNLGNFVSSSYDSESPALSQENRVALVRVVDDLFDMLTFLRNVNETSWESQGLEEEYQILRKESRPYLLSESSSLPELVGGSNFIRSLLLDGQMNEKNTPGVPSTVHSYQPDFTGEGLGTFSVMTPRDKELAFATMTAFQANMKQPTK